MRLREHLELQTYAKDGKLAEYINTLPAIKRIDVIRAIDTIYPIEDNIDEVRLDNLNSKFRIYVDVMDLVFGQFIMIEQLLVSKHPQMEFELAKLLIRPKEDLEFDNDLPQKEEKNNKDLLNTHILDIMCVVNKFLKNREFVLFKQFKGVIYDVPDNDEDDDENDDSTTISAAEKNFNKQWYWYTIVRMFAKEDLSRFQEVYMIKMANILPELSYLAQKNKIEQAKNRFEQAKASFR